MTNTEILENIVKEYPFDFHELKHRSHEAWGIVNDKKYLDLADIINFKNFRPHIWNLQKSNGLKPAADYTVKSPLGETLYFKIIFQTLLYDIE